MDGGQSHHVGNIPESTGHQRQHHPSSLRRDRDHTLHGPLHTFPSTHTVRSDAHSRDTLSTIPLARVGSSNASAFSARFSGSGSLPPPAAVSARPATPPPPTKSVMFAPELAVTAKPRRDDISVAPSVATSTGGQLMSCFRRKSGGGGGSTPGSYSSYGVTAKVSPQASAAGPTTRTAATADQAWSALARHVEEFRASSGHGLRLSDLCGDPDRVSSLVAVHTVPDDTGMGPASVLIVDLSRQRMTGDTMRHLLRLAAAREVRPYVRSLGWGRDPDVPPAQAGASDLAPSLHMALRMGCRAASVPGSPGAEVLRPIASLGPELAAAVEAPAASAAGTSGAAGTVNVLDLIRRDHRRMERMSGSVRRGTMRGATGAALRDVVVVGRGPAVAALRFLHAALRRDGEGRAAAAEGIDAHAGQPGAGSASKRRGSMFGGPAAAPADDDGAAHHDVHAPLRRMRFVSSLDPAAAQEAVSGLKPASTIVVSLVIRGDEEVQGATAVLDDWLVRGMPGINASLVMGHHTLWVTANSGIKAGRPENVFWLPEYACCEGFMTFTAAGLLPLSLVFGWRIVEKLMAGAHAMDRHFVDTTPRHNLPMLLAMTDVWNDAFMGSSGRIVSPFTEALGDYSHFVAAVEAQAYGRRHDVSGAPLRRDRAPSATVVHGGYCGEYDRMLYQGGRSPPAELVAAMDPGAHVNGPDADLLLANHDASICSFFAHADVLAFGSGRDAAPPSGYHAAQRGRDAATPGRLKFVYKPEADAAEGNRPSTLLLCGRADALTCGQLVALAEHRAVVTARLWDVDPFAGSEAGVMRTAEAGRLKAKLGQLYDRIGQ
eukprot:CAMPEP_0194296496 /NCGR_PEP_ID=MMETSP0169-20130528/56279_1 /TAXON_ID=218684 /ORGANISM="Corethron pennatum, Strain L29A3" /LENGTH=829 /DNA_ID=CAMNT_0039045981 /DNA_START=273 /DNA_END=2759 /DNA_ORIENTATION=-